MRASSDHILTTQAGSLPRPDDLIEANRQREAGVSVSGACFQERLRAAVAEVVRRQQQIKIDVPGDGEFGKSVSHRVNYGAWWSYCFNRLGGLDLARGVGLYQLPPKRSRPGELVLRVCPIGVTG
jgi:5-methyltetrahydropteroyltriglutamate--homocysteine methyltransferase